ncbi:MAG: HAD family phosphatase [Lachnospiraceae bacterium]|nr:HAD family phosphatase [Lachnospiraceae bacterium]
MIKNIIFDMGNVLIDFNPMQYVGELHLANKEEEEKVFKAAYLNFKSIYMDYGRITEEEFVNHVVEGIGEEYRDKIKELIINWHKYLTPIKGMEEIVKELKDKGYKIYLLSNAGFSQHDYWDRIPASKYFDGKVVSCDVGEVKPFREIYEALYKKFNIKPEESFFIDDLIINVFGANRTGMEGYVFTGSAEDLRKELVRRGIL